MRITPNSRVTPECPGLTAHCTEAQPSCALTWQQGGVGQARPPGQGPADPMWTAATLGQGSCSAPSPLMPGHRLQPCRKLLGRQSGCPGLGVQLGRLAASCLAPWQGTEPLAAVRGGWKPGERFQQHRGGHACPQALARQASGEQGAASHQTQPEQA